MAVTSNVTLQTFRFHSLEILINLFYLTVFYQFYASPEDFLRPHLKVRNFQFEKIK